MTEDEARTKVCCGPPAISAAIVSTGAAMSGVPIEAKGPLCVGSACMAWRWSNPAASADDRRHGFCGLAGARQ